MVARLSASQPFWPAAMARDEVRTASGARKFGAGLKTLNGQELTDNATGLSTSFSLSSTSIISFTIHVLSCLFLQTWVIVNIHHAISGNWRGYSIFNGH